MKDRVNVLCECKEAYSGLFIRNFEEKSQKNSLAMLSKDCELQVQQ